MNLAAGLYLRMIPDGELVWNEIKNSMTITISLGGRCLVYAVSDENSHVFLSTVDSLESVLVWA